MEIDSRSKVLYLVRGLPGSGKTTLAASLGCPSVAADDFMMNDEGDYIWDRNYLYQAHQLCAEQTERWMADDVPRIAVHNTFTREKEMRNYVDMAQKHGYTVFRLIVENDSNRESVHDVDETTMEKMRNRFSIKL